MRSLNSAAAIITRVQRTGLGRNENATRAAITRHLREADRDITLRENRGEDVTADSRRYFQVRDRAALAALLSPR